MQRKRAFTLIELLVVMAIIAVLISLLLPALNSARRKARETKDRTQLKQIHTAWFAWASDQKGNLPTPGLARRLQVDLPQGGTAWVNGRGRENEAINTTANMYSMLVAENYFDTEILVSPTEQNANVIVMDDYNYATLNPNPGSSGDGGPIFWDPCLAANLQQECNISYASTPIMGKRKKIKWKDTGDSNFCVIGTRGPLLNWQPGTPGQNPEDDLTYELLGPDSKWSGNLCFNDGHISREETFVPDELQTNASDINNGLGGFDCIFLDDSGNGMNGVDSCIGIVRSTVPNNCPTNLPPTTAALLTSTAAQTQLVDLFTFDAANP